MLVIGKLDRVANMPVMIVEESRDRIVIIQSLIIWTKDLVQSLTRLPTRIRIQTTGKSTRDRLYSHPGLLRQIMHGERMLIEAFKNRRW